MWAKSAEILACAQPGWDVAYSEMGYAGWARRDLIFTDTRGLTDRVIAHDSPPSDKDIFGVVNTRLADSSSVVGREVLARHAAMIVTDFLPAHPTLLGGRYIRHSARVINHIHVVTYLRKGLTCS